MKFTTAWGDVLSQNVALRLTLLSLSLGFVFVSILAIQQGLREPLVVERGCFSKMAKAASSQHSKEEIDTFVRLALSQRFDSGVDVSIEMISPEEISFKKQEAQDLANKNMIQRILVRSTQANGESVQVEADRVIAVGQIRSALAFPLIVTIASTTRTEGNPYGLQIVKVSAATKKEDANETR